MNEQKQSSKQQRKPLFENRLQNAGNLYEEAIEVKSYSQLGFLIHSLINLSREALFLNEKEVSHNVHIDIYNLLGIAKDLLPHPEMEYLDKIIEDKN